MAKNSGMLQIHMSQMLQITQHRSDRQVKGDPSPIQNTSDKGTATWCGTELTPTVYDLHIWWQQLLLKCLGCREISQEWLGGVP